MSEYIVQHDTMVNIANAIRTLTGTEDALSPSQIVAAIEDEAAGGSGGSDNVQIGTIELSANVTSGTVATVSTLPFKPTYVSIYKVPEGNQASNTSVGTGSSTFKYLANIINDAGVVYSTIVQKTVAAATSPVRLTSVNTDTYGSIEFLENGFAWNCISAVVAKGDWQYIAVG